MSVKRPDPVDVEVGHRIRIERLARGLSQTALANQLGVTFQQVQKYEKGVNRVGAGRLTKIAEVLGVHVGTFFSGKEILDDEQVAAVAAGGDSSPLKLLTVSGAFRLLRAYADIEDSTLRRSIVDLVEQISARRA
jgi:transcriptional regulator with XRE-family HTH domain